MKTSDNIVRPRMIVSKRKTHKLRFLECPFCLPIPLVIARPHNALNDVRISRSLFLTFVIKNMRFKNFKTNYDGSSKELRFFAQTPCKGWSLQQFASYIEKDKSLDQCPLNKDTKKKYCGALRHIRDHEVIPVQVQLHVEKLLNNKKSNEDNTSNTVIAYVSVKKIATMAMLNPASYAMKRSERDNRCLEQLKI